ncbi:MAG: hypothetical protein ACT6FD_02360 [Methanosarcinaceae archaeon]
MSVENRDFIVERLERQLLDKDHEFEELKFTLRDSIINELRRELQNDLAINNRMTKIEQKVTELSNTLNGMMDELLDQKSELRSIRIKIGQKNNGISSSINKTSIIPAESNNIQKPVITQPYITKTPAQPLVPDNPVTSQSNYGSTRNPNKAQFNIRDIKKDMPEPEKTQPEPKTEYIIAESGDSTMNRVLNNRSQAENIRSEYIVAEDKKDMQRDSRIKRGVDVVEKRNSEDVEITTTRKKSGF